MVMCPYLGLTILTFVSYYIKNREKEWCHQQRYQWRVLNNDGQQQSLMSTNDERGGNLEVVGSSGGKARILLKIETELSGSIAICSPMSSSVVPVAVIYDEIDAHDGGRAAVALAKLLSEQTRNVHGTECMTQLKLSASHTARLLLLCRSTHCHSKITDESRFRW